MGKNKPPAGFVSWQAWHDQQNQTDNRRGPRKVSVVTLTESELAEVKRELDKRGTLGVEPVAGGEDAPQSP